MTNLPTWPAIQAITRPDGTGELTINGTSHPIEAADVEQVRNEIIRRVTDTAGKLGRAVHVAATGPEGEFAIIVHPDGQIESGPGTPSAGAGHHGNRPRRENAPAARLKLVDPDTAEQLPPQPPVDTLQPGPTEPGQAQEAVPNQEPILPPAQSETSWQDDLDIWIAPSETTSPVAPAHGQTLAPTVAVSPWPPSTAVPSHMTGAPPQSPPPSPSPTVQDLLRSRPAPPPGPAQRGWQGHVRRLTFGLISPRPGEQEILHRSDIAATQRSLSGPRTIVVINPKGGAHKTTAAMLIAATFGIHRGGYTLAWDNNETRGTLGWRALPSQHTNTAVDLLADLDRFADPIHARVGDLDNYVRSQGSAQFDVLASDEDAAAAANIDANAFRRLHSTLSRFYRIMVIDTGNNMRASNWGAAIAAADQLVIVSTVREDTAASAAWLIDGLRSRLYEDKIAQAVTVLSSPGPEAADPQLRQRLGTHFGRLTRAVLDVPYDRALVDGAAIDIDRLQPSTREAWLHATATIAEGL